MKVEIINKNTEEPDKEVLAIGYQNEMLLGWLAKDEGGDWECESDGELLTEVLAFVPAEEVRQYFLSKLNS